MTQRDTPEHGFRAGDEREPKLAWGHSLAAAAVCLGAGAAIAFFAVPT